MCSLYVVSYDIAPEFVFWSFFSESLHPTLFQSKVNYEWRLGINWKSASRECSTKVSSAVIEQRHTLRGAIRVGCHKGAMALYLASRRDTKWMRCAQGVKKVGLMPTKKSAHCVVQWEGRKNGEKKISIPSSLLPIRLSTRNNLQDCNIPPSAVLDSQNCIYSWWLSFQILIRLYQLVLVLQLS